MTTSTDLRPGDFVLCSIGLMTPFHLAGRVLYLSPDDETPFKGAGAWLDVNVSGVHLPQRYRLDELVVLPRDECALHGLCATCRGVGVDPREPFDPADGELLRKILVMPGSPGGRAACEDCGGSGRIGLAHQVTETPVGTEIRQQADATVLGNIPCEECRRAMAPQAS